MNETIKKIKQVCKCENCGNEAEMLVTCTLHDDDSHPAEKSSETAPEPKTNNDRVKGTGTCTNCGNEADMWVDL